MKQWMIPVVTLLVGAGITAGAILSLTRPWQSEERITVSTPAPKAAFTESDILALAQQQVASEIVFPTGTRRVRCISASFRPAADMWVVTCNFYSEEEGTLLRPLVYQTRVYSVSDKDGKLVK